MRAHRRLLDLVGFAGVVFAAAIAGCGGRSGAGPAGTGSAVVAPGTPSPVREVAEAPRAEPVVVREGGSPLEPPPRAGLAVATFAGGCFWCMEAPFERLPGVGEVVSGYTGGPEVGPTYEEVSSGDTGHAEAVRVVYDPSVITYERLLEVFWRNIDPTTVDQSFVDHGHQYRTAIYVHSPEQRAAALASKRALEVANRFGAPIVTTIEDAGPFYRAEAYHQDFYRTTPVRYRSYRRGSGRDEYIERIWGPGAAEH
jgi:peptide-methionine (S)-S-oxide reductase